MSRKKLVRATDSFATGRYVVLRGNVCRDSHPAVVAAPNLFEPAPEGSFVTDPVEYPEPTQFDEGVLIAQSPPPIPEWNQQHG